MAALDLSYRTVGDGEPVVMVHGLFGSASNWQSIARRLEGHEVFLVDLRNHGESPHDDDMSYPAMAADLERFIDVHCAGRAAALGHSMGGKAVMALALRAPERVSRIAVIDVAPVCAIDLDVIDDRSDADAVLAERVPEAPIRAFLLKNLRRTEDGTWQWQSNLAAMKAHMADIAGFPTAPDERYGGPALFLHGGESGYLRDEHWGEVERLFPAARRVTVPATGHWLHAEAPDAVSGHLEAFLAGG